MNVEKSDEKSRIHARNLRRLSDYENLTSRILSLIARDTHFESRPSFDRVLHENKRLVVVFSHSSPLSWIPAPCLITAHACARGGGGRMPIAVMDRFFYATPGLREVAHYVSQSDRPLSFRELVDHFEDLGDADLVVFPEGSNCFFGDPSTLQPFRSSRFVEIAIRTKTPMLLCVHRGSESWGKTFSVSGNGWFSRFIRAIEDADWLERLPVVGRIPVLSSARHFLKDRLSMTGLLTIPGLPRPIEKFSMLCELYHPTVEELSDNLDLARGQVEAEAARVHKRMEALLRELGPAGPAAV